MFTYTRNERKWVRETMFYPLIALLRFIKTKTSPKFLWNSFAVRTGLEPVTPCVTGMYSNQLN